MKTRKFGNNSGMFAARITDRADLRAQKTAAQTLKRRTVGKGALASKGGALPATRFTGQGRALRSVVGAPRGTSQGRPDGIPTFGHAKVLNNPVRPGLYPSGRRARAGGFLQTSGVRDIPVSSQQVGRPLTGNRRFY